VTSPTFGREAASLVVAIVALACEGSSGGSGGINGVGSASVTGTEQGVAFAAMDAVSSAPGTIKIADFAGLCAYGLSEAKPGATYVGIIFVNGFQVGTTQVGAALEAQIAVWDSNCNSFDDIASSGSVTLTRVDSSSIDGTFDLTTATRSHFTGSFSAPMCTMPGSTKCR
jgi:hypothetical protein